MIEIKKSLITLKHKEKKGKKKLYTPTLATNDEKKRLYDQSS